MKNARSNEDLVHDAMLIIHSKYKQINFEKGILPWAYGVLDKVAYGDYRRDTRRKGILDDNKDTLIDIYDSTESAEENVISCDLLDEIKLALKHLNKTEKKIFKRILEGASRDQIQQELELTRTALDVSVFRGRQKLKKILKRKGIL
ncbi:MAG: sigma-70 family RNA polymerase sigma factor [candidate division KSB1 bacterium]|nr:sigma-70 family RNA polymerase sigma factor [candidate division KSB1 bacterium]MDZ7318465.1 sigma-70 family RNA polymerase sigma factor [candidate division KSB1 bacterium]MDZ7340087.1 sigma-70 family RNA polymerase sigma factor [candidate division KSB1 bacterium]